ncbi:MAG: class I SAM-dependent rRNA methyltransferase [Pirellulales bacterium]
MTAPYPQVLIRPDKAGVLASRHPWILDRTIIPPGIEPRAGTIVDLVHPDGRWMARGVYNPHSRIRVRVYQWQREQALDGAWLRSRLDYALDLRKRWVEQTGPCDAMRIVNSEGDGLSGLMIDRFGDYVVIQVNAAAVVNWLPEIANWITERLAPRGILQRIDAKSAKSEQIDLQDLTIAGESPTEPIVIEEHGTRIRLDLETSQKTGYYLDQRQNRLRAARWSFGQMLDVCTYLGGFALAAARHGKTTSITAVDGSARALAQAAENAALNGIDSIRFVQADCFEELDRLCEAGEQFETIVLDPPRMAGSREQQPAALRAYHRLNSQAMKLITPGGILVTCSCSGRVSREEFAGLLGPAARRAGRSLQFLEQLGADVDHPWDAACPETEYLKCFICRVGS